MKLSITATTTLLFCTLGLSAAPENDRAQVSDFAGKTVPISMTDTTAGKTTAVKLKEVKAKEIVFVDSESGGELTVPTDTTSFRFSYSQPDDLGRSEQALNRGETDLALAGMRPYIYPAIGLCVLPENQFRGLTYSLEMFVSALIKSNRIKEAAALVKAMPLSHANPTAIRLAIEIGKAMVAAGDTKDALALFDRIPLDGQYVELYPDALDLLGEIRKAGVSESVLIRYAKLGNTADNPQKDISALWALYCEISLGKKTSAELTLGTIKDAYKVESKEFSLFKMVSGMFFVLEKQYSNALDSFAEGIVYGNSSDPWLSELLFNTAKTYKEVGNITAANEIFMQISTLYPDDPLSQKAKALIVKVKSEEEKKSGE